jgi:hypothetical protein
MKGSCLCGAVRITISAPVELVELCHCKTCRRASGAPVMAWAGVPTTGVEVAGESLARFQSSASVERTFCGRCGTSLTIWDRDYANEIFVAVAVLEEADACAPEFHIWGSDRLPWLNTVDALPRYAGFKRDG